MIWAFGFRVWVDLVLRVWGFRFRFSGLELRFGVDLGGSGLGLILGLGLRLIMGFLIRVHLGFRFRALFPQCRYRPLSNFFLGLPYRILNINHKKELLRGLWP